MNHPSLVFVRCDFSRGAFSGERVFALAMCDQKSYVGIAPLHYCHKSDGVKLTREEPSAGQTISGLLSARLLVSGGASAHISIPDGERINVAAATISDRSA